ncbi:MAG: hypothetical protein AAGC68_04950 [Verrucomicrobiota bacterium]
MSDTLTVSKPETGKLRLPGFVAEATRVLSPPALRLLGAGIQFLSTVLIARQLGDVNSASFFFWAAILTSFAPIATYGLEHLALRTVPRLHQASQAQELASYLASIRTVSLLLSLVIGAGLVLYAILRGSPDSIRFQSWHLLLPLVLAAMALVLINGEALKGLAKPVSGVFFGHFVPVSLFCVLIALNLERLSSPFLIILYSIAYVSAVILIRLGPSSLLRVKTLSRPNRRQFQGILEEGFPVFATNALGALCFITPLMILDFSRPAPEVAYVTTSFRISILFTILAGAIHGVFAPQLSKAALNSENPGEIWRVYRRSTILTLLCLATPFAIGIILPDFVMSVFGEEFRAGAGTLRLLLIAGFLTLCLGPMLHLLLMTGNTRLLASLGSIKLFLVTVLSFLFVPEYGGIGMVCIMGGVFLIEAAAGLFLVALQIRNQSAHNSQLS